MKYKVDVNIYFDDNMGSSLQGTETTQVVKISKYKNFISEIDHLPGVQTLVMVIN